MEATMILDCSSYSDNIIEILKNSNKLDGIYIVNKEKRSFCQLEMMICMNGSVKKYLKLSYMRLCLKNGFA